MTLTPCYFCSRFDSMLNMWCCVCLRQVADGVMLIYALGNTITWVRVWAINQVFELLSSCRIGQHHGSVVAANSNTGFQQSFHGPPDALERLVKGSLFNACLVCSLSVLPDLSQQVRPIGRQSMARHLAWSLHSKSARTALCTPLPFGI